MKKTKFKPRITRVKLNPEQAVLSCACYDVGMQINIKSGGPPPLGGACAAYAGFRTHRYGLAVLNDVAS